ncbi:MAG: MBL fold metallo-hydrolase, partial [Armatimonadota bacterium]
MDNRLAVSAHCSVLRGHINVGVISGDAGLLLIDFGDGSFTSLLEPDEAASIDTILLTHHHRDQACGLLGSLKNHTRVIVPEAERRYFENTDEHWNDPAQRWHVYHSRPRLMFAEPIRVDGVMRNGDIFEWGSTFITAISTPGHTDGSLTYIVDVDGHKVAFTGDLLYDAGQVWDIYSLQKGIGVMDYHGFMGAWVEVKASLLNFLNAGITEIVPSHGNVMYDPQVVITATIDALEDVYTRYASISALRTHFADYLKPYSETSSAMPMRPCFDPPPYTRHLQTTWVLISDSGATFVMDCYNDEVIRQLQDWLSEGVITSVEGLWVTHYHDDHVEAIPEFQKAFDCELIADGSVADVISNPIAWQLPCLSPRMSRVDRRTEDGETWNWHEFRMTAYHFPGQSLHHGGLLVEGHGSRMFFAGDSFAPGGLDDYCAYNRNLLGKDIGYDHCLNLLQELKPDSIFNAHIDKPFSFTDAEYEFMKQSLAD